MISDIISTDHPCRYSSLRSHIVKFLFVIKTWQSRGRWHICRWRSGKAVVRCRWEVRRRRCGRDSASSIPRPTPPSSRSTTAKRLSPRGSLQPAWNPLCTRNWKTGSAIGFYGIKRISLIWCRTIYVICLKVASVGTSVLSTDLVAL